MVFPGWYGAGSFFIWSNSNPAWQEWGRNSEGTGGLSGKLRIAHREGRLPAGRSRVVTEKACSARVSKGCW